MFMFFITGFTTGLSMLIGEPFWRSRHTMRRGFFLTIAPTTRYLALCNMPLCCVMFIPTITKTTPNSLSRGVYPHDFYKS